jgi:hypothetical protein
MGVNSRIKSAAVPGPVLPALAPVNLELPQVVGRFFPGDRHRSPSAGTVPEAQPASLSAPAQNPVELGDSQGWLGDAWVPWTKSVQRELEKTQ